MSVEKLRKIYDEKKNLPETITYYCLVPHKDLRIALEQFGSGVINEKAVVTSDLEVKVDFTPIQNVASNIEKLLLQLPTLKREEVKKHLDEAIVELKLFLG